MSSIEIPIAAVLITMLAFLSVAAADVGLDISCYNSGDDMSLSFDAQNVDYIGEFTLEPHEISFSNKGESTAPKCYYSLNQNFNGESQSSSANTNSGSLEWASKMSTGADGLSDLKFELGASHIVNNGILSSQFGTDEISVSSNVIVSEASYSEKIGISQDRLAAVGSGSTLQESPNIDTDFWPYDPVFSDGAFVMKGKYIHAERGDYTSDTDSNSNTQNTDGVTEERLDELPRGPNILAGFIQEVNVVGENDWSNIEAAAIGKDAVAEWKFALVSDLDSQPQEYSLAMAVGGVSTEGFDVLEMRGEGSDIEMQRLPPGTVNAELLGSIDSVLFDQRTSQYQQFVDEQTNAFYEDYPSSIKPSTWYSWAQKAFVSSKEIAGDDDNSGIDEFEYFKMKMVFDINSDDSSTSTSDSEITEDDAE